MSKANNPHRKIMCVETQQVFESIVEAAKAFNRTCGAISTAIKNGTKCAGYHFIKIDEKEYAIYKLTLPSGKVYIGQTKLLLCQRWSNGQGYKKNKDLDADIQFFGWDNVAREVLERVDTPEEAKQRERYYILHFKSNEPDKGYNIETNFFSCADEDEIIKYKRRYRRQYTNVKRPIQTVICIETGIEYDNATAAGRALGINNSHISAVCRGERKTAGGFHWKFGRDLYEV